MENDEAKIWWLNKKNPIYREIIAAGKSGIKEFQVIQTGKDKNTKYAIIKE